MSTPSFKLSVDGTELTLIEFDGEEEMNRLFKYSFTTEIPTTGQKLIDVIDGDAVFTIAEYDTALHTGDIEIPGYISRASKTSSEWILEFQPKLHKATTNSRAEIYFKEDASLNALLIIQSEFQNDILLNDRSPVYDITSTLPNRKLFCQLHESNWNYVARLCDHWGFHFYFDHHITQIVFADNNQYDQNFNTQFKTTSATADNHHLKILNWKENLKPTEKFVTIVGHDHTNAGTPITSSFPAVQTGLTEASQTVADVNSQAEADYIAEVRHQANNCLNHLASGQIKVPYVFPGLLIDTDDSDFIKALVISTSIRARNLNSANTGTAASFTCDFEAIPESVCFRPDNNIIGKVISETLDLTTAQRNATGEYKAELLGFENESSVHPWLRKAQTSAGGNSVDIPLIPNTEVLISFVDSNPNCPYIEHALDNSLMPVPVTNANANQAVLRTDGMLVTNSLLGRFNYSTTANLTPSHDSAISGSVKNYFIERGEFDQHNNFIDPSSSSPELFNYDDEKSGNYIFTRHYGDSIEIHEGDKLHWHNGNLYDFGGYWNYNLGNSYEENFIDQEAPLNIKVAKDSRSGDILTAGPNPGAISFSSLLLGGLIETDVKPTSHYNATGGVATDDAGKKFKVNSEGEWDANGMNITKDYNATYDYKFGEGIEISDRVNSLEITHNDADSMAIEMAFHNGVLRSWEKVVDRKKYEKSWNSNGTLISESSSVGGVTEETNWHSKGSNNKSSYSKTTKSDNSIAVDAKSYNINTGALATHNISTFDGMGKAEMDFSFQTTAASNFNFGASTSFSISAQADASLAISLTGGVDIKLEAGINLEVKLSGGMSFEVEKALGGTYKIKDGWFAAETEATKLAATTAATLEAMGPTIQTVSASIVNSNAKLRKEMVTLDQSNVKLDTSYLVVFS
jgi:uncharacterized protein involved in type VI secretion and phage assembly